MKQLSLIILVGFSGFLFVDFCQGICQGTFSRSGSKVKPRSATNCLSFNQVTKRQQRDFANEDIPCFKRNKNYVCHTRRARWSFFDRYAICNCAIRECGCHVDDENEANPNPSTETNHISSNSDNDDNKMDPVNTESTGANDCKTDKAKWCPINGKHTLCKYCGTAKECSTIHSRGLSEGDKTNILEIHNKYREKVANGLEKSGKGGPQPPAKNMNKLIWDDNLAKVAQLWADQCAKGHDEFRNNNEGWVGQNYAAVWSSKKKNSKSIETMINSWYTEVRHWPPKNTGSYSKDKPVKVTKVTGHYTAMVWGTTKKMGCGYIHFIDTRSQVKRFPNKQVLICNYSPGGNLLGKSVYEIAIGESQVGTFCSDVQENGLCT